MVGIFVVIYMLCGLSMAETRSILKIPLCQLTAEVAFC